MPRDQGGNWSPGLSYDQGGNAYADQPPDDWYQRRPKPQPTRVVRATVPDGRVFTFNADRIDRDALERIFPGIAFGDVTTEMIVG